MSTNQVSGWLTGKTAFIALSLGVAGLLVFLGMRALDIPLALPDSGATEMTAMVPDTVTAEPLVFDPAAPPQIELPCEGQLAFRSGDYRTAYVVFSRRAGRDPAAAFHLGEMYRDGLGIVRNEDLAIHAFALAAEKGNRNAMAALAHLFFTGKRSSYPEALVWYEKAALRGDVTAQEALAQMYAKGRGVEADPVIAAAWLDTAAGSYEFSGQALPESLETLRAELSASMDNKKKNAAAAATTRLKSRLAVAQAEYPGANNPCEL